MKKVTEYERFIHYGCSFTHGVDSGGDKIDDDKLSYPAHLSNIIGNNYLNRGIPGGSNDSSFARICADIHNTTFDGDDLIIVNLTKEERTMYFGEKGFAQLEFFDTVFPYNHVFPSHNFSQRWANFHKFLKTYYDQPDEAFYFNTIKNIAAIRDLCKQKKLPVLFTDFFLSIRKESPPWRDNNYYNQLNTVKLDDIVLSNSVKNLSFVDHVLYTNKEHVSKSLHFYSEGYKILAELVYDQIKDLKC